MSQLLSNFAWQQAHSCGIAPGQCELSPRSSVFHAQWLFEGISSHCCLDSALWGFVSRTHVGSASSTLLSYG